MLARSLASGAVPDVTSNAPAPRSDRGAGADGGLA